MRAAVAGNAEKMRTPRLLILCAALLACLLPATDAEAAGSRKKSIWGPAFIRGHSQFPIYDDLGVGIYQIGLPWHLAAPTRPAQPRDPSDPAYRWPESLDAAVREAQRWGIDVSILVDGAPGWANGGRSDNWAPKRPADYADFVEAASRRYPSVRYWMMWGEPSRKLAFMPLSAIRNGRHATRRQSKGPRLYARMLDAAYARIKRLDRRDLVIGGNTFTTGDMNPRAYIRAMRLPNGRPPRMDLYGHNPFTNRGPRLSRPRWSWGTADFSDLDDLIRWVDRDIGRRPSGKRIPLFLSEWFLPTDHPNGEFNFYVSHSVQARWLAAALRITRRSRRIHTLGWLSLYDDPPLGRLYTNRGLMNRAGHPKRAYYAYRDG